MNKILRAATTTLGMLFLFLSSSWAQEAANPFATKESFAAAIRGKIFECSAITYPRVRFVDSRLETLDINDAIYNTLEHIEYLEPGVVKVTFRNNTSGWFVFSDDLKGFVMVYASGANDFRIPSGEVIRSFPPPSAAGGAGTMIEMVDHQYWKQVRLLRTKMEILKPDTAESFASNDLVVAQPNALTVVLPSNRAGCLAFSRDVPGGRWIHGYGVYFGVRLRPGMAMLVPPDDKFEGAIARDLQFLKILAMENRWDAYAALESHLQATALGAFGETWDKLGELYLRLGAMRLSYGYSVEADRLRTLAIKHAKTNSPEDTSKLIAPVLLGAKALIGQGKFDEARNELSSIESLIAKEPATSPLPYLVLVVQSECSFGLRDYAQASVLLAKASAFELLKSNTRENLACFNRLIASHLATGKLNEALEACGKSAEVVNRIQGQVPGEVSETTEQAVAWAVLGRWDDALATLSNPKVQYNATSNALRALILWTAGRKDEARTVAVNVSPRDYDSDSNDAVFLALAAVIADASPGNVQTSQAAWNKHLDALKKSPLDNYVRARFGQMCLKSLMPGAR